MGSVASGPAGRRMIERRLSRPRLHSVQPLAASFCYPLTTVTLLPNSRISRSPHVRTSLASPSLPSLRVCLPAPAQSVHHIRSMPISCTGRKSPDTETESVALCPHRQRQHDGSGARSSAAPSASASHPQPEGDAASADSGSVCEAERGRAASRRSRRSCWSSHSHRRQPTAAAHRLLAAVGRLNGAYQADRLPTLYHILLLLLFPSSSPLPLPMPRWSRWCPMVPVAFREPLLCCCVAMMPSYKDAWLLTTMMPI
jgi:hypothetical protein